jgi:hypothetical protein
LAGRFELWAACNAGNSQFVNQAADGQDNGDNFDYPDLVSGQKVTVGIEPWTSGLIPTPSKRLLATMATFLAILQEYRRR